MLSRQSRAWWLHVLFFISAAAFVLCLDIRPYPLDFLIKSVPAACLCLLVFLMTDGIRGKLLAAGFFCAAAGDMILEIDTGSLFVAGLTAFLIAHLFYMMVFTRRPCLTATRLWTVAAMLVYGCILGLYLYPSLSDMRIPVLIYLVIIMGMGAAAAIGGKNHFLAIAGAWLFILSDSLIAVDRFSFPVPKSSLLIMVLYYTGQYMIALGMLRTLPAKNNPPIDSL